MRRDIQGTATARTEAAVRRDPKVEALAVSTPDEIDALVDGLRTIADIKEVLRSILKLNAVLARRL